ncbi:hypothetical protein E6C76_01095 [Pseudothauera nasutitermitis]|uniref:Uncharacterized protein n=1 Tax=Pseudothauera nasutitermitis TaxID=2565930 RepID=A0A4S4B353_9RHOO|nr:hypothetical protein [Pseudothauera nasutitermitis]THF67019.1 hypothetical protein E6C76_01095 [Pseudothauera nasutitermitis]
MRPTSLADYIASTPLFRTPQRILSLGRAMMAASFVAMLVTVMIAYPYASSFSLPAQIAAHLLLPVAAAFFKLGYVVRLAAHHALGNYSAG